MVYDFNKGNGSKRKNLCFNSLKATLSVSKAIHFISATKCKKVHPLVHECCLLANSLHLDFTSIIVATTKRRKE